MKIILLVLTLACTGCAAINAQGVLTITYNTNALTQSILTPGPGQK